MRKLFFWNSLYLFFWWAKFSDGWEQTRREFPCGRHVCGHHCAENISQPFLSSLQTMYAPRSRDGVTAPPFLQRDRFSRFQPTYPYVQHEIDLPPTISLSDGEEPPPYQGPCTLQLRDPEQQMELNRESVRAPPNRTVFDSDLIGVSVYSGGPCPPSSNSGISASTCSSTRRMAGPPPAYSEAMGHYPGATPTHPQHSSAHRGSRLLLQQEGPGARSCPSRARTGSPGSASDLRAHLMWEKKWGSRSTAEFSKTEQFFSGELHAEGNSANLQSGHNSIHLRQRRDRVGFGKVWAWEHKRVLWRHHEIKPTRCLT